MVAQRTGNCSACVTITCVQDDAMGRTQVSVESGAWGDCDADDLAAAYALVADTDRPFVFSDVQAACHAP